METDEFQDYSGDAAYYMQIWVFENPNNLSEAQWREKFQYFPNSVGAGIRNMEVKSIVMGSESGEIQKDEVSVANNILISHENKMFLITTINWKNNSNIDPFQILSTFEFTEEESQSETSLETANWKIYTAPNNFSLKHPSDWSITASPTVEWSSEIGNPEVLISKDDYQVKISFPSAFGPSVCIFNDHPDFNNPFEDNPILASSKCPEDFIEIDSMNSTHRRIIVPNFNSDKEIQTWPIFTKDLNNNFVTVPPISYRAPNNYSQKVIEQMDSILSTFEFIN